jgi:endonuclease/exonuclease/phosphatase family metal-dependent hydrolase
VQDRAEGDRNPRTRWANRGWLVAAAAAVTWGLLGALRAWFPSVVHVYGDAGTTSAVQMGLFALAWFLVPVPVALFVRRLGTLRAWRGGVLLLALGRVALQFTDGGSPQLYLASLTVVGATIALVALAAGGPSGHLARVGVMLGLGLETVRHASLGTLDLVWRDGSVVIAAVLVLAAVTVLVAERAARVPLWWPSPLDADGAVSPVWTRGPAWPWLGVGPAIILTGVLVAVPGRLEMAAGLGPRGAVLASAVAAAAALGAAALAPTLGASVSGTVGAVLVVVTTLGAVRPVGVWSALAQLGLLVAIGFVLGAPTSPGDSGPRRRGGAAAGSLVLLLTIGFAYYAAYELPLPFHNSSVLVAAGVSLGVLSLAAARDHKRARRIRDVPVLALTVTATGVVLLGAVGALLVPAATEAGPRAPSDGPVRVAIYNVHSGFDVHGRFDPDALADVLLASGADVVVLNEVDRGWLLEGSHDLLRLLADRTGMEATFAPAADDVWGNAILSRHPIRDVVVSRLPRGGAAMNRSLISGVLELGPGSELAIVGTHLHHVEAEPEIRLAQARAVAAEVARLRSRGFPVVVLGDLNAPYDAPELEPLRFLDDAVPGDQPTWPADAPTLRLDHVLITPDLEPSDPEIVATTASDHLPVIVTLTPRPTDGD